MGLRGARGPDQKDEVLRGVKGEGGDREQTRGAHGGAGNRGQTRDRTCTASCGRPAGVDVARPAVRARREHGGPARPGALVCVSRPLMRAATRTSG